MADDLGELIAEAEIGNEARKFMETDLGRCIIGMAKQDAAVAEKALSKVSPKEEDKIRELQNKVWLGEKFEEYVVELFNRGEAALEVYRHETKNQ